MSALDSVPALAVKYADRPQAHLISLRSIRPFPGVWIKPADPTSKDKSPEATRAECAKFNTRALDILIVVTRVLFSYGYTFAPDSNTTRHVKAIVAVAGRDLGFDQMSDWKLKRHIFDEWNRNPTTTSTLTFRRFLWDPQLQALFSSHPAFQFISSQVAFLEKEPGGGFEHTPVETSLPIFRLKNTPRYNGSKPLGEFIWSQFAPYTADGLTYQFTGLLPDFLLVRYIVAQAPGRKIAELRSFRCEVPTAQKNNGSWELGRCSAQYQLCSVVRLVPADNDELFEMERVRVYAKTGKEILPAEVTPYFKEKEPEATETPWTIQETGEYALFYFRVTPGDQSELQNNAPEFSKRVWVEHDQRHASRVPHSE